MNVSKKRQREFERKHGNRANPEAGSTLVAGAAKPVTFWWQ